MTVGAALRVGLSGLPRRAVAKVAGGGTGAALGVYYGCCVVVVWLLCGCCVVVVWLLYWFRTGLVGLVLGNSTLSDG